MANRTAKYASDIHGTNPQFLIEKIIRTRIHESKYWKEHCTLLNSALVLEKAVDDLRFIGGVYGGNVKPTPFLCLTLKLLQIQPKKEIIYLFVEQPYFKYLRALGVFYLRLVGNPIEVYKKLEPILRDYRKLRIIDRSHKFSTIYMDELVDQLLRDSRVFDVILPRLTKRYVLEDNREIEPYKSELEEQNLIPTQIIEERIEEAINKREYKTDIRPEDYTRYSNRSSGRYESPDEKIDKYRDDRKSNHSDFPSTSSSHGKSRFKQELIDSENAIRLKVGLRPLR